MFSGLPTNYRASAYNRQSHQAHGIQEQPEVVTPKKAVSYKDLNRSLDVSDTTEMALLDRHSSGNSERFQQATRFSTSERLRSFGSKFTLGRRTMQAGQSTQTSSKSLASTSAEAKSTELLRAFRSKSGKVLEGEESASNDRNEHQSPQDVEHQDFVHPSKQTVNSLVRSTAPQSMQLGYSLTMESRAKARAEEIARKSVATFVPYNLSLWDRNHRSQLQELHEEDNQTEIIDLSDLEGIGNSSKKMSFRNRLDPGFKRQSEGRGTAQEQSSRCGLQNCAKLCSRRSCLIILTIASVFVSSAIIVLMLRELVSK